ncbi:reverse transcriptase domain-containing protein [Tanacetum coccineum]
MCAALIKLCAALSPQYGKFLDMIRAVRINVPLVDVLPGMPNYGKFLKELISNKYKIEQIYAAFLSDKSSAMIQNKVPPKLGDPGSFLIPCNFNKTFSCNALADLGASINLMPYSLYAKLSLKTIKPTKISVRLADRSFQYPVGIAKNMLVEVGIFTFPADFVILEMEEDSKVPLILGQPFLHTADVVIRVKPKQLNLGVGTERMIFNIDSAIKHSYSNDDTCFSIDVIDEILEEDFDALLDEGSKILHSIEGAILEEEIFSEFDKFIAMASNENYDYESDEEEPKFEKMTINTDYKIKTSLEEPPTDLKLKPLPDNLEYVFLEEPSFLPIIISSQLSAQNKSKLVYVLKKHKETFVWKITNIPGICPSFCKHKIQLLDDKKASCPKTEKKGGITVVTNENDELVPTRTVTGWRVCIDYRKVNEATAKDHFPLPFMDEMLERLAGNKYFSTFQRCMLAIFHDMIEESVEVFMEDFSVFGISFDKCLNNLNKILQHCKDAHLVLNWEKCHFMVKEEIVLRHKVSGAGLEVDKAKNQHFSKIARPLTKLLEKDTPFGFDDECQKAFELLKEKLTCAPVIISPNWNLPFELMCDASDFAVRAVLETILPFWNAKALISDRGTHFCNKIMEKAMKRYGVSHHFSTSYHPQTSGQVENTNKALKRILENTVKDNHAIWSRKLDDALWAFRTAYKTPTDTTSYKLIYGKNYHLSFEIEHRAYWSLKNCNPYLIAASEKRMF